MALRLTTHRRWRRFLFVVLLPASLLASCGSAVISIPEPPAGALRDPRASVRAGLRHLARTERDPDARVLKRLYKEASFDPFWVTPDSLNDDGRKWMVHLLSKSPGSGYRGEERRLLEIGHLFQQAFPEALHPPHVHRIPELEWALSKSFLRYARDRLDGRVRTLQAASDWHLPRSSSDLAPWFRRLRELGLAKTLSALGRSGAGLEKAIAHYRAIERAGGWPSVPEGETLEPGSVSERVAVLRARLQASGDLHRRSRGPVYDDAVARAVRRFQARHGLKVDGRVGRETLLALNVTVEQRIRQLLVNLERRRWLPESLDRDRIWVNIPEFRLRVFRGGRAVVEMPVVVGAPWSPTPAFQNEIEYVVLNPYWDVPESIAVAEIAPRATSEPGYLARAEFELLDGDGGLVPADELNLTALREGRHRIRRRPGPANDLGRIKFMLPNPHRVYLHDTPARHLFERPRRAFSHGCIRLGKPLRLAAHLFPDRWIEGELERRILSGDRAVLWLEEPIPIYIVYFTAWRSADGAAHFRDDVYGHDQKLWLALEEELALHTESHPVEFFGPRYDTT